MIWFFSDPHLGHERIIEYESRPFANAGEMDNAIINVANMLADEEDTLYCLGDFTFSGLKDAVDYMWAFKCRLKIVSNPFHHDARWLTNPKLHECLPSHVELLPPIHVVKSPYLSPTKDRKNIIVLSHYPQAVWDRKHYGSWHLYGHTHRGNHTDGLSMNVSIDNINLVLGGYRPVSIDEIHKFMEPMELIWMREHEIKRLK